MRQQRQDNLRGAMALLAFITLLLTACAGNKPTTKAEPTVATGRIPAVIATVAATAVPHSSATAPSSEARLPAVVAAASATAVFDPSPEPTQLPSPSPTGASYEVAFVLPGDTLKVRSGPGIEHPVVAELEPGEAGLQMAGPGTEVEGALWVPVSDGEIAGWVNSRYLTADLTSEAFCSDPTVAQLLVNLETAVTNQDGAALAELVHPQRGLHLRHSWWNPEVLLSQAATADIFNNTSSYEWGMADGSGLPITGSFAEVIYPLLQRDLVGGSSKGCDVILGGPTTGLLKLPDPYQGLHHISVYREGQDETQFDWGTWAVGIEQWQGTTYLSFMVHYAYEI